MKLIITTITLLFFTFSLSGQLDDRPYSFKRNTIKVGIGTHFADTEIEYRKSISQQAIRPTFYTVALERAFSNQFSMGLTHRFANLNHGAYNYHYRDYAVLANFFPFGFHKVHQLKISSGVVYSRQSENFFHPDWQVQYDTPMLGLSGGIEYNLFLTPSFSIGAKAYLQSKSDARNEGGYMVMTGIAF